MSPGVLRTLGILIFAISFVLILISYNSSDNKNEYERGLFILTDLSSRLADKYFNNGAPETMEELLFEDDWKDPWGIRFRYAPVEDYFLLWSAGPDNKFEPLSLHRDDILLFENGFVESWTNDSLIEILYQSDHAALAQLMFLDADPEFKRAAVRWAVANGVKLDIEYSIR